MAWLYCHAKPFFTNQSGVVSEYVPNVTSNCSPKLKPPTSVFNLIKSLNPKMTQLIKLG